MTSARGHLCWILTLFLSATALAADPTEQEVLAMLGGDRPDVAVAFAGKMKLRSASPALVRLAAAPDGELRTSVAWALGECGDAQAVQILSQLCGDAYAPARAAAVLALAKLDPNSLESVTGKAFSDPEAAVRLAAVEAIRASGASPKLVRLLLPLLDYRIEMVPEKTYPDAAPQP